MTRSGACETCDYYDEAVEIHEPEQLRRIVAKVQAAVRERQLKASVADPGFVDLPAFAELDLSSTLPDVLAYRLECAGCGRAFELTCECYHGAGGRWRAL